MISRQTEQAIKEKISQTGIPIGETILGVTSPVTVDASYASATQILTWGTKTIIFKKGDFTNCSVTGPSSVVPFTTTTAIASLFSGVSAPNNSDPLLAYVFNFTKSEIISQSSTLIQLLWTGTVVRNGVTKNAFVRVSISGGIATLSLLYPLTLTFLISDQGEVKPPMPYILIECGEAENLISPSSGIFKTKATICFKTHAKYTDGNFVTSPTYREQVIDLIDQFAYNDTAAVLSTVANYHCHGWEPKDKTIDVDNDQKSFIYYFNYDVTCMALDN